MMEVGVESMMVSPGYSYDKAPDQKHFMGRARTRRLFRAMLSNRKKTWRFNQSPLFLEYLMGKRHYKCTPWGMPTYNIFGWQKPCYLLQDGYAESYKELMETTEWDSYGTESGNPQCANCMVHCGYEPSSVDDTFGSLRGFADTVKATFSLYPDKDALADLDREVRPVHSYNPLIQINAAQINASIAASGSRRNPRMSGREHGHEPPPHSRHVAGQLQMPARTPSDDTRSRSRLRARKSSGMDSRTGHRSRHPRRHRKSLRLSRRRDHHPKKDGSQLTGYLFDRRIGKTLADSVVRLILASGNDRPAIPYSEIAGIAFTGRDTAAGKSYEAWVKKYWEKRAEGEKNISIEPEALE